MIRTVTLPPASAAARFHALSDPIRIELIELLRNGERCVCELTDALDAAQSRLSFHLKVLKEAGMVTDRREGRWVYYTLATEILDEMREYLSDISRPRHTAWRGAKRIATICCD